MNDRTLPPPVSAPSRVAFVVIGCHRSGTSALARVLNLAGLGAMPADLVPPHPTDNPSGFWESRPIIELNDAILAEAGASWDRPPAGEIDCGRHLDRVTSVLRHQFSETGSLVIKDPRISLMVPLWHAGLLRLGVHPVYVLMARHPAEVAASLAARDGFDQARALSLWQAYMLAAERGTRDHPRMVVAYERLLHDWRTVLGEVALAAGRELLLTPDAASAVGEFVSPDRRRHHHDRCEAVPGHRVAEIYATLLGLPRTSGGGGRSLDGIGGEGAVPAQRANGGHDATAGPAWLLVTGAPRSGTSLLRALLVEHPRVGLLQEYGLTELIHRLDAIVARPAARSVDWDRPGDPDDDRFDAASRFYRDRPGRDAVTRGGGDPGPDHFYAVASGLFAGMFPGKDLSVVGDKMPMGSSFEDLPFLSSRLPGFRVLVTIRDPAAVVRSSLVRREATRRGRDSWPVETVEEAVAQWLSSWRAVCRLQATGPFAVMVVKYEDLCARPQDVMNDVFAWLGLSAARVGLPISSLPAELFLHTAEEQATLDRLLGPVIAAWPVQDAQSLMATFAGYRLPYGVGDTIRLSEDDATPFLISGFSFQEQWGRWTDGPCATLSIPHGLARGSLLLEIRVLKAFVREPGPCDVVVRIGWGEPKLFQLGPDAARIALVTTAEETRDPGTLQVDLVIVRPKRPDEAPSDSRALGILIESVTLTPVPTPGA